MINWYLVEIESSSYQAIFKMHDFTIKNIFVVFDGHVFQQTVGTPMGTYCASLLGTVTFSDILKVDFVQGLL